MDSFAGSLAAFARARAETLVFLRALPAAAGERPGVSGFFGPISLRQYATHIADHDIEHLRQIRPARARPPREAERGGVRERDRAACAGRPAGAGSGPRGRGSRVSRPARPPTPPARSAAASTRSPSRSSSACATPTGRCWSSPAAPTGSTRPRWARSWASRCRRRDADFVRATTGFAIGGVAPIGHTGPVITLIDEHLLQLRGDLGGGRPPEHGLPAAPGRPRDA